jgi:hypothetical protein
VPNSAAYGIIPGGDVRQNFPDGVGIFDRPHGGCSGTHPGQQFENRVPVPGIAFESAADLIGKAKSFGHDMLQIVT